MNRIVDRVAIATEDEVREAGLGVRLIALPTNHKVLDGTGRTWVGGKADNLGTGKAVTVAALWTNKEGGEICRGISPTLKTGDVYVLSEKRFFFQKRERERNCDGVRYVIRLAWVSVLRALSEWWEKKMVLCRTYADGATAETRTNEAAEVGIRSV